MNMKRGILMIFLTLLLGNFISAQTYKYVGADKCKACHNKAASGEQYNKWMKDPHSQALKTLSGQKAMDYGKKNGIADPSKEAKCLKCHSTYDIADPKLRGTILATEGVSCESCHGPGSAYKAIPVMRSHDLFLQNGGIVPNKELCLKCHGSKENPFFKEFNYEASLAKIAHPNPEKGKHN
jgi:hypothetical protein